MRNARPHVARLWYFENRRLIGMAMTIFGVVYAIGIVFTVILTQSFLANVAGLLIMWFLLFGIATLFTVSNVIVTHMHTTSLMNETEHKEHSKNIGMFLIVMLVGCVLFLLPLLLTGYPAPLMALFGIGGILLVMYFAIRVIFGYKYFEIEMAAVLILVMFAAGFIFLIPKYNTNPPLAYALSFLLESTTLVTVLSLTGLFMLNGAAYEFLKEFRIVNRIKS